MLDLLLLSLTLAIGFVVIPLPKDGGGAIERAIEVSSECCEQIDFAGGTLQSSSLGAIVVAGRNGVPGRRVGGGTRVSGGSRLS